MKKTIITLIFLELFFPIAYVYADAFDDAKKLVNDSYKGVDWNAASKPTNDYMNKPQDAKAQSSYDNGKSMGSSWQGKLGTMSTNDGAATSNIPGYNGKDTYPQGTSAYNPSSGTGGNTYSVSGAATDKAAECSLVTDPKDPRYADCQANLMITKKAQSDTSGQSPNRSFDGPPLPDTGVAITASYSGCTSSTKTTPAGTSPMTCSDTYPITQNNVCSKTLTVDVTYSASCPATATRGPILTSAGPPPTYKCETDSYSCTPGDTLSGTTCTPAVGPTYPATLATAVSSATVTPIITDKWADGCSSLEARVPSGFLPPDNNNIVPGGPYPGAAVDACLRQTSICSNIQPDPVLINGQWITRSCWGYDQNFTCIENTLQSDCPQLMKTGLTCNENGGSPACSQSDPNSGLCRVYEHSYDCAVTPATTETVADCGSQQYCAGGVCHDAGKNPDPDFGSAVSRMEAGREAGRYMSPDPNVTCKDSGDPKGCLMANADKIKIFKGTADECSVKFGIINCCSGTGVAGIISDLKAGKSWLQDQGKKMSSGKKPSDYVADSLFGKDSSWLKTGFKMLPEMEAADFFVNMLQGKITITSFVSSLGSLALDIAWKVITLFGLFDCSEENKVTEMKIDEGLCIRNIDDYCDSSFLGICLVRVHINCCYNSKLARIIAQQTRKKDKAGVIQAQPFGLQNINSPRCEGFTPDQLSKINFSNLDLSEFYASLTSGGDPLRTDKPTDADSTVTGKIAKCSTDCPKPANVPGVMP